MKKKRKIIEKDDSHLSAFSFDAGHLGPFFDRLGQVDHAEWHFNLTDLVVFRETVEIVDGKHQRLGHGVGVGDLPREFHKISFDSTL